MHFWLCVLRSVSHRTWDAETEESQGEYVHVHVCINLCIYNLSRYISISLHVSIHNDSTFIYPSISDFCICGTWRIHWCDRTSPRLCCHLPLVPLKVSLRFLALVCVYARVYVYVCVCVCACVRVCHGSVCVCVCLSITRAFQSVNKIPGAGTCV